MSLKPAWFMLGLALGTAGAPAAALPDYLRDRGTGVTMSLFGTYAEKGEWLVYPFYEYEKNNEFQYKGSELGTSADDTDYLGAYRLNESLLYVAYVFTDDIALEFETAFHESATLERAADDTTSGMPATLHESGWGETETDLRWRLQRETATRPEIYTFLAVDIPLQKNDVLIGTADWAADLGLGMVKGFSWGTLTPRVSLAYDGADGRFEFGEWAVEYLKKISDSYRVVLAVEGESDEVSLIGELQWRISPRAVLKVNCGIGLTKLAPDVAPEIGLMMTF